MKPKAESGWWQRGFPRFIAWKPDAKFWLMLAAFQPKRLGPR